MGIVIASECPIARRAQTSPDAVAVIEHGQSFSFAAYHSAISECTASRDVSQGECVGICAPPSYEYLCLLNAVVRRSAVVVPISPRLPATAVEAIAQELGLTMLDVEARPDRIALDSVPTPQLDAEAPAVAVLTSGSASQPKAVVHSLASLGYNALGANENMPLGVEDRWLLSLPLHHVSGLGILFRTALSGGTIVIPGSGDIAAEIRSQKITHVSVVSQQLAALLRSWESNGPMRSLKGVLAGGSSMPPTLVTRAIELGIPLHLSYGSTEMGSQITTTAANESPAHMATSGRCLPHREIAISNDGEILVRGKTLCKGYLHERAISPCVDDEGWFHSGDAGQLDEEGYLTVLGRRDNMFISGGENIYPEEIERALMALAGIERAAVFAIPDNTYGERPVAFIKREDPTEPDTERIREALAEKLPRLKLPDAVFVWPADYPEGGIKIDREFLRDKIEARLDHAGK